MDNLDEVADTLSESGSEDNEDDLDEIKGVTSFTVYFSSNFFPVI